MKWLTIEREWQSYIYSARQRWQGLSYDELFNTLGRRDLLSRRLMYVYGLSAEDADREIEAWQRSLEAKFERLEPALSL